MSGIDRFRRNRRKYLLTGAFLGLLILLVLILGFNLGAARIPASDILRIILGKITGIKGIYGHIPDNLAAIVWEIRLPRVITGAAVGCGLAVSGAVLQALLKNPLADPYTIGVSTGAAFGASLAIYLGLTFGGFAPPVVPFAFLSALATLYLVGKIARRGGAISSGNLIIAGIIVSSVLSAGISFIKNAAGEQVSAIVFWLMGSLSSRSWSHAALVLPIVLIGTGVAVYFANDLNLLSLGEREGRNLGLNTQRSRKLFLVTAALMTAACVSVSGVIGFVGLVIPHLIRFSLSADNRVVIPLSALAGGLTLMLADNATRLLFTGEIPVGVLTTLIGGPFFICIFMKKNKEIQ